MAVDAPTSITGNASAMQMTAKPTDNIAQQAVKENAARGNALSSVMPKSDTYEETDLGDMGPVVSVSTTAKVAVEINSVSSDVISSMKTMPPPVDIEAVERVKAAIAKAEYPIDLNKISDKLMQAYEDLGPPPMDLP